MMGLRPGPRLLAPGPGLCPGHRILIRERAVISQEGVQFLDQNISQPVAWAPHQ